MDLQRIVRWFLPRDDRWFGYLELQAVTTHQGALELLRMRDPGTPVEVVRDSVQLLEHAGDKLVHEMEEALAKTFVTPIDREDLQRLSTDIDTVLDLTNASARACVLLGVEQPSPAMVKLAEKLAECTGILQEAMPYLRVHRYTELVEDMRRIRRLEKDADATYREAVSVLFRDPNVDARVLFREKEILENLENAVDHCERVAHSMINLAVKHG